MGGASSPADVQGGMLVGGVLVRAWLPICDSVNDWIVSPNSYLFGLPQWAALVVGGVLLLLVHPFTATEPRSWSAFGYSFKAIAFGICFIIGANGAATLGVNDYFLDPAQPDLARAFMLRLTLANTVRLVARNLLGFATLLALWHSTKFVSLLVESRCSSSCPRPRRRSPECCGTSSCFLPWGSRPRLAFPSSSAPSRSELVPRPSSRAIAAPPPGFLGSCSALSPQSLGGEYGLKFVLCC